MIQFHNALWILISVDFLGFWPNHELKSTKCSLGPSIVKISTQEKKLNLRRIFITSQGIIDIDFTLILLKHGE